ncbi:MULTISPECIES: zinc ribbon domain regulatory protein CdsZ [Chlamydia]|uniref:Zinc ribbon domain protein n=2 Tax=Chlamydia TaxID=810 RepID=A0ABP2X4D0_CHLPS|nr:MULTISPECIES: zinc ribbon domain-containing protein [Chlamydia]AFS19225.1 putative zinc ribbon domain protein [Chlamydia psittaci 84/55]AFS22424.1 putative zinc ribbon domain protein [Chlamydia psittaci VS225]EPJ16051.1 putative zinc ribbon domain protein [Chlamydia psittaci 02DC18]EPJ17154.1 putative zinc ribbon domain protein [Chlamydia psittaci 02DC22]EPJ19909.1 putative zinc ribbon domain protein [Chlamydia psittaci 02DC23]EPJ21008.1 putative zinc ribbon domain protein [Chlamydia psitt
MHEALQSILAIQELDIKMIRLMRVKKEHQKELAKVQSLKSDIRRKVQEKELEMENLKNQIKEGENRIQEISDQINKLESQQAAVKKMDEFNALTQEMTAANKERRALEHQLSDLMDKQAGSEDLIVSLKESLTSTENSSFAIEKEICESIKKINEEGRALLQQRSELKETTDPEMFLIYERLLNNKKDRVVVPIDNRVCSGCHIVLTPQHENLVRKKDRLIFCEHCSRILYWREADALANDSSAAKRRRRRAAV